MTTSANQFVTDLPPRVLRACVEGSTLEVVTLTAQAVGFGLEPEAVLEKMMWPIIQMVGELRQAGLITPERVTARVETIKPATGWLLSRLARPRLGDDWVMVRSSQDPLDALGARIFRGIYRSRGYRVISHRCESPEIRWRPGSIAGTFLFSSRITPTH